MKFLISGAGIAGLTAAIMLRLKGHEVEIFEQEKQILPYGAGLQLSPNGTKILQALGVALKNAVFPERLEMREGLSGAEIFSLPINPHAQEKWGAPYITIHRADLQKALTLRLEEIGGVHWHFGQKSFEFSSSSRGISLHRQEGDYLIIADGVHSQLAKQIYPHTSNRHSGFTAYRGVVPYESQILSAGLRSTIWVENGQHAVTTRISNGDEVNFVAITPSSDWENENWRDHVPSSEIRALFADWQIAPYLEACETVGKWALIIRDPYPKYYEGRAILIGDAAHPMLPTLAQGAVQALEDVAALARALSEREKIGERFHKMRAHRVQAIQHASQKALMRYHRPSWIQKSQFFAAKIANRYAPSLLERELDWIYKA